MKMTIMKIMTREEVVKNLSSGLEIEGVNLNGTDLNNIDFKYSVISHSRLLGCSLSRSKLRSGLIKKSSLHGLQAIGTLFNNLTCDSSYISECLFEDCDFTNADFRFTAFNNVVFRNCNLLGASFLNSALYNVVFENVSLDNTSWFDDELSSVKFQNVDFNYANFSNSTLLNVSLNDIKNPFNSRDIIAYILELAAGNNIMFHKHISFIKCYTLFCWEDFFNEFLQSREGIEFIRFARNILKQYINENTIDYFKYYFEKKI